LLERQIHALTEAGCNRMVADKRSGRNAEREELRKDLDYPHEGDTLVVPSLDRLGCSIRDLIALVSGLRKHGIGFTSLHEALDTATPGGRLVFHVFAALAEFIRELIVQDTNEGLDAARARGARLGRPPAMTEEQVCHARDLLTRVENTVTSIAKLLGVSSNTIHTYVPELKGGRPRSASRTARWLCPAPVQSAERSAATAGCRSDTPQGPSLSLRFTSEPFEERGGGAKEDVPKAVHKSTKSCWRFTTFPPSTGSICARPTRCLSRGALNCGECGFRGSAGCLAEPLDLGAEIGLGVEPGVGNGGVVGNRLEGDRGPGVLEATQGLDGLAAGELVPPTCGSSQVGGVVSQHRRCPSDCRGVGCQSGDAGVEVVQDLGVHLDEPLLAADGRDDVQDVAAVLAVLGEKLGDGDEHRAGQAGWCVRAGLLDGQPAVAVRQGLGGAESRWLDQAASASGPSGSNSMACPLMSTLRGFSQCSRTVVSCSRA
jgi:DNA invertase Pin-like site-specific DNA recombinase